MSTICRASLDARVKAVVRSPRHRIPQSGKRCERLRATARALVPRHALGSGSWCESVGRWTRRSGFSAGKPAVAERGQGRQSKEGQAERFGSAVEGVGMGTLSQEDDGAGDVLSDRRARVIVRERTPSLRRLTGLVVLCLFHLFGCYSF